ncbi:MAG TPA: OmpH family outer membrane protein [Bacteroidales bacterium]|nr:OmpH family outer membrane protein [Bacteroidales bacterium]
MKRFLSVISLVAVVIFLAQKSEAQTFKFAHINSDELIKSMPEYDSAMAKLERTQKELVNALQIMQVELNNKLDTYNKESKNYTELVKQTKEQELSDINKRIQDFQQQAQTQLQEQQSQLTQPIFAKVDKAIKEVGKEGGYIYVFDVSKGQVLFFDETKSTNILAAVKTKLGLK